MKKNEQRILAPEISFITITSPYSVMEKLPATSYVRVVDIWLISTQLAPFILVVLTTMSELFTDEVENAKINHHGFTR